MFHIRTNANRFNLILSTNSDLIWLSEGFRIRIRRFLRTFKLIIIHTRAKTWIVSRCGKFDSELKPKRLGNTILYNINNKQYTRLYDISYTLYSICTLCTHYAICRILYNSFETFIYFIFIANIFVLSFKYIYVFSITGWICFCALHAGLDWLHQ